MIVDNARISFVYIGDYYEQKGSDFTIESEIEVDRKIEARLVEKGIPCPYIKRRRIKLIKTISADGSINPYLFKAMAQNRHSLSSLDDYSRIILCSCFDIYQLGEELAVTFRVASTNEISPLVFANFLLSASSILLPTPETEIAINTNIHSPGDVTIITRIDSLLRDIPILVLYIAIVGGRFKDFEVPSIIDFIKKHIQIKRNKEIDDIELQSKREQLRAIELDNEKRELDILVAKQNLGISQPKDDTDDTIEERLRVIEENFDKLKESSAELQIKPFDEKVIPFEDIKIYTMKKKSGK